VDPRFKESDYRTGQNYFLSDEEVAAMEKAIQAAYGR
jgi:hypothetical protein